MSLNAATSGFVIVLLSLSVVQGVKGWSVTYTSTQICALKKSTVDMKCTYTFPAKIQNLNTTVQQRLWFTKENNNVQVDLKTDPDYTGRVEYYCDENICTLSISNLTERDSAEYKFRFTTNQPGGRFTGLPGITLTISDLQVEARKSSNQKELTCHSSCSVADHPSCVWYNNGQKMEEESSSCRIYVSGGDSYSCAVKGHEGYRSAPVYPPKRTSVSVSSAGEIVEGSSVTLTCSSDANPAANYTWYKEKCHTCHSKEPHLAFSSIQSSDSGQYYCIAENVLGSRVSEYNFINVKYPPKPPSVSMNPSGAIMEGSSVTLTCSSDANPAANYTWYNENGSKPLSEEPQLNFTSIQLSDSGEYHCAAENELGTRTSAIIRIDVQWELQKIINICRWILLAPLAISLLVLHLCLRKKKKNVGVKSQVNEPAEMIEFDSHPIYENRTVFATAHCSTL